jgi:hypothetical protein
VKTVPVIKWLLPLLVFLLLVAFWWQRQPSTVSVTSPVSEAEVHCQPAQQSCIVDTDIGQLQWAVTSDIQYLKPFISQVKIAKRQEIDIRQVSIEFLMQGMQMATNRVVLKKVSEDNWQAQSVLPICASGRKDWLAMLKVETSQGNGLVKFHFTVPGKGN